MRRRGQALVEIALVAPIMLTLMAITFEFGYYFYQLYYLNNAVRLAARTASMQKPTTENKIQKITACITNAAGPVSLSATPTVVVHNPASWNTVYPDTDRTPGYFVTVEARAIYWPFTRLVDLRTYGAPSEFIVNSTFVIR